MLLQVSEESKICSEESPASSNEKNELYNMQKTAKKLKDHKKILTFIAVTCIILSIIVPVTLLNENEGKLQCVLEIFVTEKV